MKKVLMLVLMSSVLLLMVSACNSTVNPIDNETPTAEAINPEISIENVECMFESISPAEVVREIVVVTGDSPKIGNFSLTNETAVRIYWNQESKENFSLSTTNLDPKLLDNPERKTTYETIVGPSSGCSDTLLSAGEYEVNVEDSVGPWIVVIQEIKYKK